MITLANFTHPLVFLILGIWSAPIIGFGLLLEAACAGWKFGLGARQVVVAVLTCNVVSAALAVPLAAASFLGSWEVEESLKLDLHGPGRTYDSVPSFVLAFLVTTLFSALIEAWIIQRFWKVPRERNVYRWWLLANAASNGLVFLGFVALFLR